MTDSELTIRGKYAFFWAGWPSNWHSSKFIIDGKTYGCVEQWMMWSKAEFFGDKHAEKLILGTSSPKDQKKYGRAVKGYDDARWSSARYAIVLHGVIEKYRQNPDLKKLLFANDYTYVEASPYDTVWGIGLSASDPDATSPSKWRGQNLLGKATTEARRTLLTEDPSTLIQ